MGPIVFSMVLDPSNKMKRSYLHASLFSDFDITIFLNKLTENNLILYIKLDWIGFIKKRV